MNLTEMFTLIGVMVACMAAIGASLFHLSQRIDSLSKDVSSMRTDMHAESKDFHGRLCRLEEKYLKGLVKRNSKKE